MSAPSSGASSDGPPGPPGTPGPPGSPGLPDPPSAPPPRSRALLPGDPPGGRRAAAMWGIGVAVYVVAVTFRTSLGVAGLEAAARFRVSASALSAFSILQLLVYAGLQVPVGLLVDRLGARKVLGLGALLFTAGQLAFALAPSYGMALAARALLGCGDAMTFIAVLRLGSCWFPARRGPLVAQLAALAGMAGNLFSTLVLARLLDRVGWTAAFAGSSLAGVCVLALVLVLLREHPEGRRPAPSARRHGTAYVRRQIAEAWREPGTRLGMWVHFTTQFPAMTFMLLWGLPFLVRAQGLSPAGAGDLLTLVVVANMLIGLIYGQVVARHHGARLPLALGTVTATAVLWLLVLGYPGGQAPTGLLVVLCTVLGACGPASMLGFDFARPANPPERQGTASGIVNMGGFVASMANLLAVGVLLDVTGDDFRVAFSAIFVLEALGLVQILRLRGRAARRERERVVVSRVTTGRKPVHQ